MSRPRAPRKIADLLGVAAGAAFRRYGFAEARLLSHWRALMGEALGSRTLPVRLSFPQGRRQGGTLHVRANGPTALEVQHLAPQIIERLNGFFGYPAVAALRLVQGPLDRRAPKGAPSKPPLALDDPELATVNDEALRRALARLKANLSARQKR